MISKPMMGGTAQKSVMPQKKIPSSDGLAALQQRLSGAKQNKPMKKPMSRMRTSSPQVKSVMP